MNGTSLILVMGVCGSGKTTIGQALADRLGWRFLEGDDFHPESNVQKMSLGEPLDDSDRFPWLKSLNAELCRRVNADQALVLACSALKEAYRVVLLEGLAECSLIVCLRGEGEQIEERLRARTDHFMPASLLSSQMDTLEVPPGALELNIGQDPQLLVDRVLQELG